MIIVITAGCVVWPVQALKDLVLHGDGRRVAHAVDAFLASHDSDGLLTALAALVL